MSRNTSISLGDYFDEFIQNTLDEGRYKNASEMVRAGLRLLEEEEKKMKNVTIRSDSDVLKKDKRA